MKGTRLKELRLWVRQSVDNYTSKDFYYYIYEYTLFSEVWTNFRFT